MSEKLRIGIIGTGGIAHSHMRSYLEMDDVEIIGASDIIPVSPTFLRSTTTPSCWLSSPTAFPSAPTTPSITPAPAKQCAPA